MLPLRKGKDMKHLPTTMLHQLKMPLEKYVLKFLMVWLIFKRKNGGKKLHPTMAFRVNQLTNLTNPFNPDLIGQMTAINWLVTSKAIVGWYIFANKRRPRILKIRKIFLKRNL